METDGAADGWGALADGTRRTIMAQLADRPMAVGELAAELPVSRSAVSQHLKILKDAGLVSDSAAGTRRIYRLNPIALVALRDQLDTYWQRALVGYAEQISDNTAPHNTAPDNAAPDNAAPIPRELS